MSGSHGTGSFGSQTQFNAIGKADMKYENIQYEALDGTGRPAMRAATVIGELPHQDRATACAEAAEVIGKMLGRSASRSIPFGAPVYEAFGFTRPAAKAHPKASLLLTLGHNVSLSFCG